MSDSAERQLIELVSREQRGLRRILVVGITTLVLVVAMSAALGYYYYVVAEDLSVKSRTLTEDSVRLEKAAFKMRRDIDQQKNRAAGQDLDIRRAYEEIRQIYTTAAGRETSAEVLPVVVAYLQRGRHSLADEHLIEARAKKAGTDPQGQLVKGTAGLLAWDRSGSAIQDKSVGLPASLQAAQEAFVSASADPDLRQLAQTGLAWISFIDAASTRSSYSVEACQKVSDLVGKIGDDAELGLQPLYWRAQCNRKMGRTRDALNDYSLALNKVDPETDDTPDRSEQTLQMNAFHGLGTVLITTADLPADADVDAARALAERVCEVRETGEGSALMKLTRACLDQAIALRVKLGETENQQSGSGENKSFTYLRDQDFQGAFDHAQKIEKTGLFAWNELVRALSAEKVGEVEVARQARRNVSMFSPEQFNICELKALMIPEIYESGREMISVEHDNVEVDCK
ncbi:hypothetical protein [Hyphomonas johnsonii]|uniref:Uncharacterized protein n=1 Tax=Hyphomonas johnsonii MHS-2 TaxID=1280950 RepID=A0A059FRN6_9PROT|nr:hypothetical protein [Hyphomonas johnsonii]KCZ93334.1 hypothetical protein HJO_05745 [Hyphomonas johnsonii MHS-2]